MIPLFWTLLGLAVGSFLNVVADRLPQGHTLSYPPSHCPACGQYLTWRELVPVVSYLRQNGRCRHCHAGIGWRSPLVEMGTAVLFTLVAWRQAPITLRITPLLLVHSVYLAVFVVVTVTDLEHGLIPNRVIMPAIGLALVATLSLQWPNVIDNVLAGLIGGGLIAVIIWLVPGGMGWGDARLATFIGLVVGLPGLWLALFIGFVSGGLVAAVLLVAGAVKRGDTMPLGPFLALGGATTLLFGDLLLRGLQVAS